MLRTYRILTLLILAGFSSKAQSIPKNFVWGVNGHPLTQVAYGSIDDQITHLKDLGVNSYRLDVLLDANGYAKKESLFYEVLKKLNSNNISPLPAAMQSGLKDLDNDAIYNKSFIQGKNFATRYGKYFSLMEVNNEADNKMLGLGNPSGTKKSHYNLEKAQRIISAIKGFTDGVKAVKSSVKITLSVSYIHYYYLQLLKDNNVNYDIIGCHWYSNMGDIKSAKPTGDDVLSLISQQFGKPIWLTEFNYSKGTAKVSFQRQNQYITTTIPDILSQGKIGGLYIYELYDEPALKQRYPNEACYGLIQMDSTGNYSLKDAYNGYKQIIQRYR